VDIVTTEAGVDRSPQVASSLQSIDLQRVATDALVFCVVLIGYVLGAYAAFRLLAVSDLGAVFFPPAGLSLAALVLNPRRRWPMILVAVCVGEVFVDMQHGIGVSLALGGFALANAGEALAAASLVRWRRDHIDLARVNHLVWFVAGATVVGPFVGSVVGAGTVAFTSGSSFVDVLPAWWLGDALGALVVGALIVAMVSSDARRFALGETIATLAFTGSVAFGIHWWTDQPAGFIAIIPLMFVSARTGTRAAAIGSAVITIVAVTSWVGTDYVVAGFTQGGGLLFTKAQLLTMAAASLLVAAVTAELEDASRLAGVQYETVQLLRRALAPANEMHAPHVDVEGVSRSADPDLEVGGDWYDVIETEDGLVGIVIGDVVGHGEEALVTMGQLRFAAQAFVLMGRDSGQVLDWLAHYADTCAGSTYATCFVAYFVPATGELNYASAGHPPGLVCSRDGTWRWLSGARSTPIGVPSAKQRVSETVSLDGDATLVVYTDGVVERAGEVIDTGLARMFDAVSGPEQKSVTQLVDRLVTAHKDDASFVRVSLRVDAPLAGSSPLPPPVG
jgi:integral membrane sensor domain MASE1